MLDIIEAMRSSLLREEEEGLEKAPLHFPKFLACKIWLRHNCYKTRGGPRASALGELGTLVIYATSFHGDVLRLLNRQKSLLTTASGDEVLFYTLYSVLFYGEMFVWSIYWFPHPTIWRRVTALGTGALGVSYSDRPFEILFQR